MKDLSNQEIELLNTTTHKIIKLEMRQLDIKKELRRKNITFEEEIKLREEYIEVMKKIHSLEEEKNKLFE